MTEPFRPYLFVQDLRLDARVGVNPGEEAEQPIALDVLVGIDDLPGAAASEHLRDTVDYVGVARVARKVVEARHYPLVETLATEIAKAVARRPGAQWARVKLRKLQCLKYAAGAGVEVEVQRSDAVESPPPVRLPSTPQQIVIIGGGVAGMAAALWCNRLGYPALLVDASSLGGQLHLVNGVMQDIPAMAPLRGSQLLRRLLEQFGQHGGHWSRARLVELQAPSSGPCKLRLEPMHFMESRSVILASGVRRRQLGLPGEEEFLNRGILRTATKDNQRLAGRRVLVVGGGDGATENALILAELGSEVTLVHRGKSFSARRQFLEEAKRHPKITTKLNTQLKAFLGSERLERVELVGPGGSESLEVDAALVRIGWLPNSEGLPAHWLDSRGFVGCDGQCRVHGQRAIFVAGDLAGRPAPSVATAFGSGATAARAAVHYLEGKELAC